MSVTVLARPGANDASAYFQGYIAEVEGDNIGEQLLEQLGEVERLLGPVDDGTAVGRYAPGKWSIKEVLGHLSDTERIFAYRLLRIGRGDATPLPGFDENAYVPAAEFDRRPLADLLEEFRVVRLSTVALVDGLSPQCWDRRGEASGNSISARALPYIIVGHVRHHVRVLQERYGVPGIKATATA